MIEVQNLTRKYGNHTAVDSISFKIEDGRIYGFLGPNGAGKSTTMNIITGCLAATSGTVTVNGCDIFEEPVKAKKCIGYLPEIPPLYPDMTPLEYLRFVGRAKGMKKAELNEAIPTVMAKTGISDVANKLIKSLSKGYKQRVGIAQAILGNPHVVILDEPTVGLDPKQIVEIRNLIKELGENHTVILSSHILPEVSEVCDEIIIISNGEIVASDTAENLISHFNPSTVTEVVIKGDADSAANAVAQLDEVKEVEIDDGATDGTAKLVITSGDDIREKLAEVFMNNGILVISMNLSKASLEDIFLEVTSENLHMLTGGAPVQETPAYNVAEDAGNAVDETNDNIVDETNNNSSEEADE
ncbi:MAG: ATP-binding cassette domain-containing protein [Clostridia bacterium]|nr:ATP-binding cassette domain-containing protein [Clostridia bacterium]